MKLNEKQLLALDILTKTDGYKLVHQDQYPKNTELIFSNLSLRSSTHPIIKTDIYIFGLEYIKNKIIKEWENFFKLNQEDFENLMIYFEDFTRKYHNLDNYNISRFHDLYKYGRLPLDIRVIQDDVIVPIGTPIISVYNTKKEFFWMTNYIESYLLCITWPLITSSTTAFHMKKIFDKFLKKTSDNLDFSYYQGTDFSYRGMSGNESGLLSGLGHLSQFEGSSTLQAVIEYEKYWGRLGTSVPATEHSVMSSHGHDEVATFNYLLDQYPSGLVSIVSDTWNIWNVIENVLPSVKERILKRDGKVVIRPDSGNPKIVICGNDDANDNNEKIGLLKSLDNIFGSSINSKGYKVLNEKIGIIYGDQINFNTVTEVLQGVEDLGYSSENIVFGLGATFYQNNNRDTFGHVFKSTLAIINGEEKMLFKNPINNSQKKSHKGLVGVFLEDGKIIHRDQITWEEFNSKENMLKK